MFRCEMKYSCYEYEVYRYHDLEDQTPCDCNAKWLYKILFHDAEHKFWSGQDSMTSEEWYHTEQEAIEAACCHIDRLEDGPGEPDYDAPTASEMYQRAHDDRQKLRGF